MKQKLSTRARFGAFVLDVRTGELHGEGESVLLGQQLFQVLLILLEREGDLVTRDELKKMLWPNDTVVEFEHGINNTIKKLRRALDDSAEEPRYIGTIPRRGYRLLVPVEWGASSGDSSLEEALDSDVRSDSDAEAAPRANLRIGLLTGKTISHYRVLEIIGGGGMGLVYRAEDLKLGRAVALKFLLEDLGDDPKARERFEREAKAVSALDHPNICSLYEFDEYEGHPFIAMQLLQGKTLRDHLAEGRSRLSDPDGLEIAIQIAAGLETAHEQGIIHRDIKPANIFITEKNVAKILDFGVAKVQQASELEEAVAAGAPTAVSSEHVPAKLTRTGLKLGTAGYMSPEQVRGEPLDARTDIFSFGLVLYEMAAGERAFTGETEAVLHDAIVNREPNSVRELAPDTPPKLQVVITKCLAKEREQRFQAATEVQRALAAVQQELLPVLVSPAPRIGRSTKSKKLWIATVLGAVGALAVMANIYYGRWRVSPKLTEKDTVVLAEFENKTGDTVFDDTLKTALSVALNQSPFLNVLPNNRVGATLGLMGRPAYMKLTPEVARDLCQRTGSKAYIAGSIATLENEYVLGLKAVNCQNGDTLAEEQATASGKMKVLDAVEDTAAKLRRQLGESLATVHEFDVRLEEATTSSLEALKAYSLARREDGEHGSAALHYDQRAIELDPNFALGYRAVGWDYDALGEPGRASEYFTKAFHLREHASERERLSISADYYLNVTGELDKAVQANLEWIQSYPRDDEAYNTLGIAYERLGQFERALQITSKAILLAPNQVYHYQLLADNSLALQRFNEARQAISEAHARNLDSFPLHLCLYSLAFIREDFAGLAGEQQWFADRRAFEHAGVALASETEAYAGHLAKARELTRRAVEAAVRTDNQENAGIYKAIAAQREAAYGYRNKARQSAEASLKLAPLSQGVRAEATLAFAMAGNSGNAESLLQELNRDFPLNTQIQSLWAPAVRGKLLLLRKNTAAALDALQPAGAPIEFGSTMFATDISCLFPTYVRGEVYLAAGQGIKAAAEFQKILDHSGIVWNCWTGALARLGLARAYALDAGANPAANDKARAAYENFLSLWKDADPDIPIYRQAKAEYAKLTQLPAGGHQLSTKIRATPSGHSARLLSSRGEAAGPRL